jgi:hypothetical protein
MFNVNTASADHVRRSERDTNSGKDFPGFMASAAG